VQVQSKLFKLLPKRNKKTNMLSSCEIRIVIARWMGKDLDD